MCLLDSKAKKCQRGRASKADASLAYSWEVALLLYFGSIAKLQAEGLQNLGISDSGSFVLIFT